MPVEIVVNKERVWWVFSTLIDAWRRKLPPYDRITLVPARLPDNLERRSVEHALWLFCACYYMRGRVNSKTALLAMADMYEDHPDMFQPATFAKLKGFGLWNRRMELRSILQEYGLGFNAEETTRFWVANFLKLHRFWDGNPILLFERTSTYEELCDALISSKKSPDEPNGFFSFRHKMVSMLVYFYARAEIIDPFEHPPPHDFHHCRTMLSTEALSVKGEIAGTDFSFEKMGEILRPLSMEYCQDPATTLDLADALWHLSREFCRYNPGNMSTQGRYEARRTSITARPVRWTDASAARFYNGCEICSVRSVCRWNIPSANNYVKGKITVRRELVTHPQLEAFERPPPKQRQPLPVLQIKATSANEPVSQLDMLSV
jgi:hypothetical protein